MKGSHYSGKVGYKNEDRQCYVKVYELSFTEYKIDAVQ